MFNFRPDTDLPGFRVNFPEDQPGFRIEKDGSVRRPFGSGSDSNKWDFHKCMSRCMGQ